MAPGLLFCSWYNQRSSVGTESCFLDLFKLRRVLPDKQVLSVETVESEESDGHPQHNAKV